MNGSIITARQNPYYGIPDPPERVKDDFAIDFKYESNDTNYSGKWVDANLSRSWDSIDFKFETHTPDFAGFSNFDGYMPWKGMRLCNLSPEGEVTAYEGDAKFERTPETGDIMVEIPKFYYVNELDVERKVMTLHISPNEHEGWFVSPRHQKFGDRTKDLDKIYVSAYLSNSDRRSISGSGITTSSYYFESQRGRGNVPGYYQMDYLTTITIDMLRLVETGTFTLQGLVNSPGMSNKYEKGTQYTGFGDNFGWHSGYENAKTKFFKYRNIEDFTYGYGTFYISYNMILGALFDKGYLYITKDPLGILREDITTNYDYRYPYPISNDPASDTFNARLDQVGTFYKIHIPDPVTKYNDFSMLYIPDGLGSVGSMYGHVGNADKYSGSIQNVLFCMGGCYSPLQYIFDYALRSEGIDSQTNSSNFTSRLIYLPPEK